MRSVAAHFGAAVATYETAADIQRQVAASLAERIARLSLPRGPRVLEIGCGTGLLSRGLIACLPAAEFYFSDIAPPMAEACRKALARPVLVMDGERPCFGPGARFDLICASLSFQWFRDPARTFRQLAALLAPGGHLAFATLAEDSFQEWRAALAEAGLESGIPAYPGIAAWQSFLPGRVEQEHLLSPHEDGRAFLRSLKRIGAGRPAEGYRPLPPGELRRVLRRFEAGIAVTYHIAYGLYLRPGTA
jgi:malonyl-CoA O-methyltransferase